MRVVQGNILTGIENKIEQGANELEDEEKYLLEVYFETMWEKGRQLKKHWLRAVELAQNVVWKHREKGGR